MGFPTSKNLEIKVDIVWDMISSYTDYDTWLVGLLVIQG